MLEHQAEAHGSRARVWAGQSSPSFSRLLYSPRGSKKEFFTGPSTLSPLPDTSLRCAGPPVLTIHFLPTPTWTAQRPRPAVWEGQDRCAEILHKGPLPAQ